MRTYEWGDPKAPAVLLCHGMFDHGRGFDLLAPLLATRYRVVALDARGHGESGWVDTYMWALDVLDIVMAMRALGRGTHLVGHSKGGGQATDAASMAPELVGKLVNVDGFGPPDEDGFRAHDAPDISELTTAERCSLFLDRRRGAHERLEWRPYASFEELVARRAAQNPRLDPDWLRYFVFHGARQGEDGWRWKADPQLVAGGFGPFKPRWIAPGWRKLRTTMLAVVGDVPDAWGPLPESVLAPRLANVARLERVHIEGAGHFIQMERPAALAAVILDFLAAA